MTDEETAREIAHQARAQCMGGYIERSGHVKDHTKACNNLTNAILSALKAKGREAERDLYARLLRTNLPGVALMAGSKAVSEGLLHKQTPVTIADDAHRAILRSLSAILTQDKP